MEAPVQQHVRRAAEQLVQALDAVEAGGYVGEASYAPVAAALDECVAQLSALSIWGPDNRLPSSELWNIAGRLLSRGWLQNQARTKPRGYAGDHEMLARIYEEQRCADPLGNHFDRYFQSQAAPQAVRNRMRMIRDAIVAARSMTGEQPLRVAIVGSALGLEVRDALQVRPSGRALEVAMLDLDPAAIEFARSQLAPLLAADQLTAVATNLFRLPDRPQTAALLGNCDLIFCPGLFDYLDEDAAVAMLRCLFARLASGGALWVFQFAPHNPTRAYMEWIGNWYLTYRDADQFRRLVAAADLAAAQVRFGAEPLGVDLFVQLFKHE